MKYAFNPSRSAPVEYTHAHAQDHTLMETDAIHWSCGQPITAPREHGAVPWSRAPQPWQGGTATPPAVSSPIFEQWEWESTRQPSGYWTTTPTTEPRPPLWHILWHCKRKQRCGLHDFLKHIISVTIMLGCVVFWVRVLGGMSRWSWRALGGAWFAPATTPAPRRYSLRLPYRSCRSNQPSPDRLTNFVINKLILCLFIVSLTTLVLPASTCLASSSYTLFLVPACSLDIPASHNPHLPTRLTSSSDPKMTQPAPSPPLRTSSLTEVRMIYSLLDYSPRITKDRSNFCVWDNLQLSITLLINHLPWILSCLHWSSYCWRLELKTWQQWEKYW